MAIMGDRIKSERIRLNYTQEELGNKLGIQKAAVAKMENGTTENIKRSTIEKMSLIFGVNPSWLLGFTDTNIPKSIKIPVLGRIVAGIPIEATEYILGYEEITTKLASTGEFFALKVQGDSMLPEIKSNDIVIVRKQPTVDSGDVAIVLINGNEATVKQVLFQKNGMILQAYNPSVFPTTFFSENDIKNMSVQILGKVIEIRRKIGGVL